MRLNNHVNQLNNDDFIDRLLIETNLLKTWFDNQEFKEEELEIGTEIEFLILDENYLPIPKNMEYVQKINDPCLTPEVGSAQLEINSPPYKLTGKCFAELHQKILGIWHQCWALSCSKKENLALIGGLPLKPPVHYDSEYITNCESVRAINQYLITNHSNFNYQIHLHGEKEELIFHPHSIMAVLGMISSLQLHLKVSLKESVRFYNTMQLMAGPMLALCSNSLFFFEHKLWNESRIELFEQLSIVTRLNSKEKVGTALFGNHYLSQSFFELFQQNLYYPSVFPEVFPDLSIEKMMHVRRQNSFIFRWNRPVLDFNHKGEAHLRIEHRGPAVGPTIVDIIANAAFFYGITTYLARQIKPIEQLLPFHFIKHNFYQAARFGLHAQLTWLSGHKISAYGLLIHLLPLARKGLIQLNIAEEDIEYYLEIIRRRLEFKQNGSIWQDCFVEKYGKDFKNMMGVFITNQCNETPISDFIFL